MKIRLLIVVQLLYVNFAAFGSEKNFDSEWPAWYRQYVACRDTSIGTLQLDEVPLSDVLQILNDKFTAKAGYSLGFSLVGPFAHQNLLDFKVSLSLGDSSMLEALKLVFAKLNARMTFTDTLLRIRPVMIEANPHNYVLNIQDVSNFKRLHIPKEIVPEGPTPQLILDTKKHQVVFWGTVDEFQVAQYIVQSLQ